MIKRYTLSVTPENNNPTNYSFDTELEVLNWLIDAGFTTYSKDANGAKLFLRDRDNTSAFYTYDDDEELSTAFSLVSTIKDKRNTKLQDCLQAVIDSVSVYGDIEGLANFVTEELEKIKINL